MKRNWARYQKWCAMLAGGGMTLGILQGFEGINWANLITQLLTIWLSAIAQVLFGGELSSSTAIIGW